MKKYTYVDMSICIYIERIHRQVFEKQYLKDYKITLKDKPILVYYKILVKLFPDFRQYLKFYKEVIIRAYNQKRLSIINFTMYHKVKKINTSRYSD